ncbi:MAG: CvpA family protein [Cyclobacteriaceae bacterium]|nr:CvpA family protein [Cyclobacteriaceae bacterium]
MNIADIVIAIFLIIGAYHGYKKGFIIELIGIVAFIVAVIGGLKLLHIGMESLAKVWDGFGAFLPFAAFLVIFVVIIILVNLAGEVLKKSIDWTPLGVMDNFAGALIGLLKMSIVFGVMIWVINILEIRVIQNSFHGSLIIPIINDTLSNIKNFIATVFPSIDTFIDTLRDLLKSFSS